MNKKYEAINDIYVTPLAYGLHNLQGIPHFRIP